jgi:hypothetical protein
MFWNYHSDFTQEYRGQDVKWLRKYNSTNYTKKNVFINYRLNMFRGMHIFCIYKHTCAFGHNLSQDTKHVYLNTRVVQGAWL